MKTLRAFVLPLLALVVIAAAPVPTATVPEISLPDLAPADPIGIEAPSPLPQLNSCLSQCLEIRRECDANCTTTQCHRECRDSAVECLSHC